jgi:ketosteroid isomerase-like protein
MAEDNITLARRGYEAFNRDDMEAVLALMDPEVEIVDSPENPDRGTYRQHAGFVANVDNVREVFEDYRNEPLDFVEAPDTLLVSVRVLGRGKGSGIETEAIMHHVWTFRDQKAVRLEIYRERADAESAFALAQRSA